MTEKKNKKTVEVQCSSITLDKGVFQSGRKNFAVLQFLTVIMTHVGQNPVIDFIFLLLNVSKAT